MSAGKTVTKRLFIAVDVDAALRERVAELTKVARMLRVRLVPRDQLHLTVRFLGDVDEARVPDVVGALERAAAKRAAFTLNVANGGVFGRRRSPHVVWAGVDDTSARDLEGLARDVDNELTSLGFGPREKEFRAHLTLARGKDGCRVDVDALEAFGPVGALRVDELVLFESELNDKGAKHTPIARAKLT